MISDLSGRWISIGVWKPRYCSGFDTYPYFRSWEDGQSQEDVINTLPQAFIDLRLDMTVVAWFDRNLTCLVKLRSGGIASLIWHSFSDVDCSQEQMMVADHDISQSDSSFDVVFVTRLSYLPNHHINHMEKIIEFKPSFLWLWSYVSLLTVVLALVNLICRGHSWYGASKSLKKRTYWIARNVRDLVASSSIIAVFWCFLMLFWCFLMSSTDMSHGCAPQILVGFWVTPPYDRDRARNIQNWRIRLANLFVIIFCYGMSCIGSRICERLWPGIHSCGNEASDWDYDGRTQSHQPCQTSHGCSSGIWWRWVDEDGSHAEVEMRNSEVWMANCGGARFRLCWLAIRGGHTAQAWTLQVDASDPSSALPITSAVVRTRFFQRDRLADIARGLGRGGLALHQARAKIAHIVKHAVSVYVSWGRTGTFCPGIAALAAASWFGVGTATQWKPLLWRLCRCSRPRPSHRQCFRQGSVVDGIFDRKCQHSGKQESNYFTIPGLIWQTALQACIASMHLWFALGSKVGARMGWEILSLWSLPICSLLPRHHQTLHHRRKPFGSGISGRYVPGEYVVPMG